jgi:hypothetical protein
MSDQSAEAHVVHAANALLAIDRGPLQNIALT